MASDPYPECNDFVVKTAQWVLRMHFITVTVPLVLCWTPPQCRSQPRSASFPPHILLIGESHFCAFKKQSQAMEAEFKSAKASRVVMLKQWLSTWILLTEQLHLWSQRHVRPGKEHWATSLRVEPFVATGRREQGHGPAPPGRGPSHVFRQQRRFYASSSWRSTS